jgi:hypothetical protein
MDLLRRRHRESGFMSACLATQQRFVVDNTNQAHADRTWYIEAVRAARFRAVGYFYEPDHKASYERNEPRTGKRRVPPAGLFGVLKHLERRTSTKASTLHSWPARKATCSPSCLGRRERDPWPFASGIPSHPIQSLQPASDAQMRSGATACRFGVAPVQGGGSRQAGSFAHMP